MDIEHHNQKLQLDGALHVCPLEDPKEVLDLGTGRSHLVSIRSSADCRLGTGIWAIDFADEYPDCQVVGIDLSPVQPSWIPPNCRFEVVSLPECTASRPFC